MNSKMIDKNIEETVNCYVVCTDTINHCLDMGGDHSNPSHINTMMDCAKICSMTADFMIRSSDFHIVLCELCADACDKCEESCDQFDDPTMKKCAKECRRCAESCRKMAEDSSPSSSSSI